MGANPIRVGARIISRADKIDATRELLVGLVGPMRAERGCTRYELMQSRSDPAEFVLLEEWENEAALDSHFTTEHVKAAFGKAPELLAAERDIRQYAQLK